MFRKNKKPEQEKEPDKRVVEFLYDNEYISSLRSLGASKSLIIVAAHTAVENALKRGEGVRFDEGLHEYLYENPEVVTALEEQGFRVALEVGTRAMDGALEYLAKDGFFPQSTD